MSTEERPATGLGRTEADTAEAGRIDHRIPSFQDYEARALAAGFDEVAERVWEAFAVAPEHSHPFSVQALVVEGEMWLTSPSGVQHLLAGDSFVLDREVPHAERYGRAGATYWAARRRG